MGTGSSGVAACAIADSPSAQIRVLTSGAASELASRPKCTDAVADGLQALLDSIAQMAPEDPALAERVHTAIVLSQAQGGSYPLCSPDRRSATVVGWLEEPAVLRQVRVGA
jgi:hypothetical protein